MIVPGSVPTTPDVGGRAVLFGRSGVTNHGFRLHELIGGDKVNQLRHVRMLGAEASDKAARRHAKELLAAA